MNRPGHNSVSMFLGKEVEHSPSYEMKTLFVVGVQSQESIEEILSILARPNNLGGYNRNGYNKIKNVNIYRPNKVNNLRKFPERVSKPILKISDDHLSTSIVKI